VGVGLEDVHGGVEVPAVAARLTLFALAQLVLLGLFLLGVGVEVAAGEDNLLAVGGEVTAGRLADAGADAAVIALFRVADVNLVEGVAAVLLLGLEDDLFAVGGEIALAGADEIARHLADVGEVGRLGLSPVGGVRAAGEGGKPA